MGKQVFDNRVQHHLKEEENEKEKKKKEKER